jgi:hypothetical protein
LLKTHFLVIFPLKPGMRVIFVSHQWLGGVHPDPEGRHAAVLRSTLQGVMDGVSVSSTVISRGKNMGIQ